MFSSNQVVPVAAIQVVDFVLVLLKVAHQYRVDVAAHGYFLVGDGVHYLGNDAVRLLADVHALPEFHFVPFEEGRAVVRLLSFCGFAPCFRFRGLYRIFRCVAGIGFVRSFPCRRLPDSKRFRREPSDDRKPVFRSTILPPDTSMLKGSRIRELSEEICSIING